jgi:hypothetical protein
MPRLWRTENFVWLIPILLICSIPCPSSAQTTLKATVGWGNVVRLGRWTPIFVFVRDSETRSIDLQVHGTYGQNAAMLIHQTAVAQALPTEFEVLFPVNAQLSHIAVTVADANTGRTLASQILEEPASFEPAGKVPPQVLAPNDPVLGITGQITDGVAIQSQLKRAGLPSGILDPSALPDKPAGYDGIDTLIMTACDLREVDGPVQQAIVNWVRAGGNLLILPGTEPMPASGALLGAFPCSIGVNKSLASPTPTATRPIILNARELNPKPDAEPISFAGLNGYSRRLGLGRISVMSADIAPLTFAADADANSLWRALLTGMMEVKPPTPFTEHPVSDEEESSVTGGPTAADSVGRGARETIATRHILQSLDAAAPHRQSPWRHTSLVLLGIFLVVGPVDSVLQIYLRQQRHWITLLGWLGLVASLGIYVAAKPADEPPVVSNFRLIDQSAQSVVAMTDIVAVESNRARHVPLALDPAAWCEPANQAARFFSPDRFLDMRFREDHSGCRPEWLDLEPGQPQSIRSESFSAGSPLLAANLRILIDPTGNARVSGEVKNLSAFEMTDLQIATISGICRLSGAPLPAGGSTTVDAPLVADAVSFKGLPPDAGDVSPARTDRINDLLKNSHACVYTQMPEAADVSVIEGEAAIRHIQLVRAVFPVSP